MQAQCGVLLNFFCPTADAGPPPPTRDGANACSALDACCPTAPVAQRPQCEQVASLGNPGLCNTVLSILCP
jgi:hypothetical protein